MLATIIVKYTVQANVKYVQVQQNFAKVVKITSNRQKKEYVL